MRLVIDTQVAGFAVKSFFAKHKTKVKWAGIAAATVVVGGVTYYVCHRTGILTKASDVADVVSSTAEEAAEVVADAAE